MTQRLAGKTVMITAAAQGIGRASVLACVAEGATVHATDINAAGLASLSATPGVHTHMLDVTDPAAPARLAASIPPLDGLFNCAGVVVNGTALNVTDADWAFSFELNIHAMFRVTRAFLPGMLARVPQNGGSAIVNMASMASSVKGFVNRCAYGTSKAAVIGFTRSLAADFVGQGIRANALCPATVDTPSLRGRIASAADPVQAERDFIARQPMGRLATVDDMTPMVVYLLADESRFMTGQSLLVDGGTTI